MHQPAPDLRVFQTIVNDHGTYDAYLLSVNEPYSNWNRSDFGSRIPLTIRHFQEDMRLRLREFVRSQQSLKGQDYSDRRLLFPHLAFTLLHASGKKLHARGETVAEMTSEIRNDLLSIILSRHMNVDMEDHPLHGNYKAKMTQGIVREQGTDVVKTQKMIGATEQDVAVAKLLLGNSTEDTLDALTRINPWLASVDDTHYLTAVPELRRELLSYVRAHPLLTAEERRHMVETIIRDWEGGLQPEDLEAMDELEAGISKERGIPSIFDLPPQALIDHCFTPLIGEDMTQEAVDELVRRKPIFDHLMMHSADKMDHVLMRNLGDALKVYARKADLRFIDLPHSYLLIAAFDMDRGTLDQFLH